MMTRRWGKDLAIGCVLLFFALEMSADARVPLLSFVDLAVHWTGHVVTSLFPGMLNALGGPFFQIFVPLGLALYFLRAQGDDSASALCFGWAGTNALDVARYIADAPYKKLPLFGSPDHEWSYVFGHLHAMRSAQTIAVGMRAGGWVMLLIGIVVLVKPYVRQAGRSTIDHAAPAA
jgi:hypothetical protein